MFDTNCYRAGAHSQFAVSTAASRQLALLLSQLQGRGRSQAAQTVNNGLQASQSTDTVRAYSAGSTVVLLGGALQAWFVLLYGRQPCMTSALYQGRHFTPSQHIASGICLASMAADLHSL